MTWQDWGAIGEIVGAIAVVITLIYSDALQDMLVQAADSDHIGPIIIKLTGLGYPEDVKSLEALGDEELRRFRMWHIAQQTHWDNMHYQYQQGYLDREYYEDAFRERVVRLAPIWQALGLTGGRRSFFAEIERLTREHRAGE
jgi:hypothetical protein